MRKTIRTFLIIAGLLVSAMAFGQNRVYCRLVTAQKSMNKEEPVTIDFGKDKALAAKETPKDKAGKPMTFTSLVEAMNAMAASGWKLEETYAMTFGYGIGAVNQFSWVLSKEMDSDSDNKSGEKEEQEDEE